MKIFNERKIYYETLNDSDCLKFFKEHWQKDI